MIIMTIMIMTIMTMLIAMPQACAVQVRGPAARAGTGLRPAPLGALEIPNSTS